MKGIKKHPLPRRIKHLTIALSLALIAGTGRCHGEDTSGAGSGGQTGDPMQTLKAPDANAVSGTPVNFTGWLRRAHTLLQTGDYEGALEASRNAIALEKDNVVGHLMLADVLVKLHRYPEAETEYQYVMLRQPTDLSVVTKLGDLYMEQGNFVNAQNMYRKVVAINPGDPEAKMSLARAFEGSNDLSSAAENYERVAKDFSDTQYANVARYRLAQVSKAQDQARADKFFPIDGALGAEGLGWWDLKKMPLHVYIDDGSDSQGFRPELVQSVQRAMQSWSAASRNSFTFVIDPPDRYREAQWKAAEKQGRVLSSLSAENLSKMPADPIGSQIHVHWSDHLPGAAGLTWTSKLQDGNPTISKAHVWLETDKLITGQKIPSVETPAMASIFEAQLHMLDEVATHEFGHVLGLVHLNNPNDIMAPGMVGLHSGEPSSSRELSPRDIKALAEHYDYFATAVSAPNTISPATADVNPAYAENQRAPMLQTATPENMRADYQGTVDSPEASSTAAANPEVARSSDFLLSSNVAHQVNMGKGQTYDPLKEVMFLLNTRQYDSCLERLNKVLSNNANNSRAHYLRACVYVYLRQYKQAAADYQQVLKKEPLSPLGRRAAEGIKQISH